MFVAIEMHNACQDAFVRKCNRMSSRAGLCITLGTFLFVFGDNRVFLKWSLAGLPNLPNLAKMPNIHIRHQK